MSNVFFVGCGPGDPELITVKAKKLIQKKKKQHKDKRHLVQVWSGHKASISWLNILKFKEISHYYVGKEKILIVENRT